MARKHQGPREYKPVQAWIPQRPDSRGAPPAKLGDVLVGAENFAAAYTGSAIPREQWRKIVGDRIANRTRVGKKFKGVLTIKVASSAWSSELSFLKPALLNKLRLAGHDFDDLRFKVDKIDASSAPAAQASKMRPRAAPQKTELPPGLQQRLASIEDPNLRAAIAEAASWSLNKKD